MNDFISQDFGWKITICSDEVCKWRTMRALWSIDGYPQGLYPCDRRESISTRRICFPDIDFTMVRIVNLTPIL